MCCFSLFYLFPKYLVLGGVKIIKRRIYFVERCLRYLSHSIRQSNVELENFFFLHTKKEQNKKCHVLVNLVDEVNEVALLSKAKVNKTLEKKFNH